jgi:hypothetical protein
MANPRSPINFETFIFHFYVRGPRSKQFVNPQVPIPPRSIGPIRPIPPILPIIHIIPMLLPSPYTAAF